MADTRQRLIDGAIETIRTHGLTGTTARSIAATAGVNQALVFYHFGTVHDLLQAACLAATQARVESFAERLDEITDLRQLLELGRALHTDERAQGNVMVLAQLLAGAEVRESYDEDLGRFRINVEVSNHRFGPLFGYHGTFSCSYPEGDLVPDAVRPVREQTRV